MPTANTPPARYDLPWKIAIAHAFRDFMDFFFPALGVQIDWTQQPRFRDKELAGTGFGAAPNVMVADKLVEVCLCDEAAHRVLIHVEVQSQRDASLVQRVRDYNYRISQEYALPVTSIVLLADDDPAWYPHGSHTELMGWVIVTRLLFQHDWSNKRIIVLFNVINWMMALPDLYQRRFWRAAVPLTGGHKMRLLNPLEQMFVNDGWKKGRQEGLKEGLEKGLKKGLKEGLKEGREEGREQGRQDGAAALLERLLTQRFGALSKTAHNKLAKASLAQLEEWSDALPDAQSLRQIFDPRVH
jgi:hypothetical protein